MNVINVMIVDRPIYIHIHLIMFMFVFMFVFMFRVNCSLNEMLDDGFILIH